MATLFVLFSLTAALLAHVGVTIFAMAATECFPVKPMPHLTVYSFFNHYWFEVNRTGTTLDEGTNCGKFWYEHAPALPGDPELVVFDHRYNESNRLHDFVVFGNATTLNNLTTIVTTFPNDTAPSTYTVLDTDYDWYAVAYSCAAEGSTVKERMWVFSRRQFQKENITVVNEEMKNVAKAISSQGQEFEERAKNLLKPCVMNPDLIPN